MEKENFINLLNRKSPKEIMDFLKAKGKGPKSVCPITFYDEIVPTTDTNVKNFKNAETVETEAQK